MSVREHGGSNENIVLLLCQFKLTTSAYQQLQARMQPSPWRWSAACIQHRQKDGGWEEQRTHIRLHLHMWIKRITGLDLRCEGFFLHPSFSWPPLPACSSWDFRLQTDHSGPLRGDPGDPWPVNLQRSKSEHQILHQFFSLKYNSDLIQQTG